MTKLKMLRTAAAAASGLVLSLGVVGMASAYQSDDWGQDGSSFNSSVKNDNAVNIRNKNKQNATSGEAKVSHNHDGGDATTGDAANANATGVTVGISSSAKVGEAPAAAPVENESNNSDVKTSVKNASDVVIKNSNDQYATTGDAKVDHNTTGGNAKTGNATNTNTTTIGVTIAN